MGKFEPQHKASLPLEEILMAERYMRAKLRKLELDQIHNKDGSAPSFHDLKETQGGYRAVTGVTQRGFLKMLSGISSGIDAIASRFDRHVPDFGYDAYVSRMVRLIDEDRRAVEEYEGRVGHPLDVRQYYHAIQEAPEVNTWSGTQRAFDKVTHALRREEAKQLDSRIRGWGVRAKEWVRYHQRELVTGIVAPLAATLVLWPVNAHHEHKDHNRPVAFKMYEDETLGAVAPEHAGKVNLHAMNRVAMSAHNLNSWINMEYNQGPVYRAIAEDWDVFVRTKQGEKSLTKENELRHIHHWGGIDPEKRPWADIFLMAMRQGREFIDPAHAPVRSIAEGKGRISGSWDYHKSNERGHMQPYQCGDSKNPRTCYRYVCDSKDFEFKLDRQRLLDGIKLVNSGKTAFPALPSARTNGLLETGKTLGLFVRGRSYDEVRERVEQYNSWARSVPIVGYNGLLQSVGTLQNAQEPGFLVGNFGRLEATQEFTHQPCSGPRDFPFGWDEHNALVAKSDAVLSQYHRITGAFGKFDTVVPRIEKNVAVFRAAKTGYDSAARKAYRDFGNAGIAFHNARFEDNSFSAGQYTFFLALTFLGLTGAAGFAAWKLQDKAIWDRRWRNRMNKAGLPSYYSGTDFEFRPRNRIYR